MKYLWIIMIVIPILIWSIASIIDIVITLMDYTIFDALSHLEGYTQVWLTLVICALFLYSFSLWMSTQ